MCLCLYCDRVHDFVSSDVNGTKVFTLEDGWVLVAVKYWKAGCVGWLARLQARGPVCGPGAHQPGVDELVRVRGRRGGPRAAPTD
jgi:hypothetical protein